MHQFTRTHRAPVLAAPHSRPCGTALTQSMPPDVDAQLRANQEWSECGHTYAQYAPCHRPPMTDDDRRTAAWIWLSDLAVVAVVVYFTFF